MQTQSYKISEHTQHHTSKHDVGTVIPTLEYPPLGIYANKVANTDSQKVTNKPLRSKLHKIRQQISKRKLASDRVCNCGYKPLSGAVEIHINKKHNSAKVAGVETCGSVWACPVCRTKIMTKRAKELKTIGEGYKRDGGKTVLVTLTVPHYKGQHLDTILGSHKNKTGLSGAMARLRQHRRFRQLKEDINYDADARAIENTYGQNGYHSHIHLIFYYRGDISLETLESRLYDIWADVCVSAGLEMPTPARGVKVTEGEGEYLAKWGAPCELTSDHKQAKNGNKTISELEASLLGDSSAETILKQYYQTMHGRKLLTWAGTNLRKKYLADPNLTDEQLATDDHNDGERLFVLPFGLWKQIYHTNNVGQMLTAVEKDPDRGLHDFCKRYGIDSSGAVRSYKQFDIAQNIRIDLSGFMEN